MDTMDSIKNIATAFADRLAGILERDIRAQVKAEILGAIEPNGARRRKAPIAVRAARRKGPVQLCPAPKCRERAAPVFGQLCAKHKDAPKRLVAKWREARRARKAK